MATTHNLNAQAWRLWLDSIESEDQDLKTDREKVMFAWDRFLSENTSLRFVSLQDRFADWLQGLPFHLPFENYEILQTAKSWGSIPQDATEKQEDKILENWYHFMTAKFFQLKTKVEKYENLPARLLEIQK